MFGAPTRKDSFLLKNVNRTISSLLLLSMSSSRRLVSSKSVAVITIVLFTVKRLRTTRNLTNQCSMQLERLIHFLKIHNSTVSLQMKERQVKRVSQYLCRGSMIASLRVSQQALRQVSFLLSLQRKYSTSLSTRSQTMSMKKVFSTSTLMIKANLSRYLLQPTRKKSLHFPQSVSQ